MKKYIPNLAFCRAEEPKEEKRYVSMKKYLLDLAFCRDEQIGSKRREKVSMNK